MSEYIMANEAKEFLEKLTDLSRGYGIGIVGQFRIGALEVHELTDFDKYVSTKANHQIAEYQYVSKKDRD